MNRPPPQKSDSSRRSSAHNMSKVADEVRKAFDTWTSAWNCGDVDGYLEAYENSDTVRYVSGSKIFHGKEDIVKTYKEKGIKGQLALEHFEVDAIGLENAIAFGEFQPSQTIPAIARNNCRFLFGTHENEPVHVP